MGQNAAEKSKKQVACQGEGSYMCTMSRAESSRGGCWTHPICLTQEEQTPSAWMSSIGNMSIPSPSNLHLGKKQREPSVKVGSSSRFYAVSGGKMPFYIFHGGVIYQTHGDTF
jgi:hypothetical protein